MKNIFLTGATGTIGSALLPRLLADEQAQITLLMRASDEAALAQRLAQLLAHCGIAADSPQARRVQALRGDISLPHFGLSAQQDAALAERSSHLIHCAASVNLTMSALEASATAVTPTRSVLALARRCASAGVLRKVDLVSTVGVWGRTPGHMPERRLPEVRDFHNTYEAAKAEAERVVWAEAEGLPLTVHRPSMVVGETGSGRVMHFQVFYHLCEFLSGARTFGIMPKLGNTRLDTVPVDWVADAIVWASHHPHTAGQIFHLCSGPDGALPLAPLQTRVRSLWQARGRPLPRLRTIDRGLLRRLIPVIGALTGASARRALRGLSPVLDYLDEDQGFTNTQTIAALADAGLPVPPIESYLDAVLGHYLDVRAARARA